MPSDSMTVTNNGLLSIGNHRDKVTVLTVFVAVFLARYITIGDAIPINNMVLDDPEIECGPASVTINFNTLNKFEGHVYVMGLFDRPDCRSEKSDKADVSGIEIPFESCNLARTRSLNPRGVFVSTTVVISFHPKFITKVDRAYQIQCFYMEASKSVSSQIAVSEIVTEFKTQVVPMPICRYEILENDHRGPPVYFAAVGQQVYHKWTCESETRETFCALVHSCIVDDGKGDTIQILDSKGCALDKHLLNNLEYIDDLVAGQEAHVYKYADRSQLFYQCQITISIKEPNLDCVRPECPEPEGFGAYRTNRNKTAGLGDSGREFSATIVQLRALKRKKKKRSVLSNLITDVRTQITTLEIGDDDYALRNEILPHRRRSRHHHQQRSRSNDEICVSPLALGLLFGLGLIAAVVGIAAASSAVLQRPEV